MKQFFKILLLVFIVFSCKKDPEIINPSSETANLYAPVVPTGWPNPVYDFTGNTVTYDIFTLGRHCFY